MTRRLLVMALALLLALPLTIAARHSAAQPTPFDGRPDQVELHPTWGVDLGPAAAQTAPGFDYVSPPTAAARPFTHLLLRREASLPAGANMILSLRASTNGSDWSAWQELQENHDLWVPDDGPDVWWSSVIDVGATARFWQVRGFFVAAPAGARPTLRNLRVSTVDAGNPPPPQPAAASTQAAVGKPAVVSRTAWGNPDGQGSRNPPDYYPVNHMVVHHSADPNTLYPSEPNWAARVRAIWSFHTFTRGWGDVGYNYLIDPDGTIYEGRAGGDDAVGFHDRANYGSMGVVLIGTYSDVQPQGAAQNALVRLLGWKASQKDIDPTGRSFYYGCSISKSCYPYYTGAVVANIAGHRQTMFDGTSCPGDRVIELLPEIRNRVKQLLAAGENDNGDLQIDELESSFSRSEANWYDLPCGAGEHSYLTYATDGVDVPGSNSATWRPNIPKAGTYRVYAAIPQGCDLPGTPTGQARYYVQHATGETAVTIDQRTTDGWVDLGLYSFNQGLGGYVTLSDVTGDPFSDNRLVLFDAIKWVPESSDAAIEIQSVSYDWPGKANGQPLTAGELLKVSFRVRNTGPTTLIGQAPRIALNEAGELPANDNGYVYEQDECFAGNSSGTTPAYPKETNRLRVTLGASGWDANHPGACSALTSDNPWRWGLNGGLAPGQSQTIIGYLRFSTPGEYSLRANIIQEYIRYFYPTEPGVATTTISVAPERAAPASAHYDSALQPLAQVYTLSDLPDNYLARVTEPVGVLRGSLVGSFAWDGNPTDWGTGGPAGQSERFLIEQTRSFIAPVAGAYTFRVISDDAAWLLIDGTLQVAHPGLHDKSSATAVVNLAAGVHTLAFRAFERSGLAAAGYQVQMPDTPGFSQLPDGLGNGALRFNALFAETPRLRLAADDLGGSGVAKIVWSLNDGNEQTSPGGLIDSGPLENGNYQLRYQAIDNAGNRSSAREIGFSVRNGMLIWQQHLPLTHR